MEQSSPLSIVYRYAVLLILGAGNLFIFYLIAAPLTIYPVFFLLDQFYGAALISGGATEACEIASGIFPFLESIACIKTTILFEDYYASIIPACIAGSAYYLLLILNLTTPMLSFQRVKSLFFILGLFLILNIIRIFSFAMFFASKNYEIFNIAHVASWYFGSTILVILLWFTNVYLFSIKSIPIYTDIKEIISQIRSKK